LKTSPSIRTIRVDDLKHVIRKDVKKSARVEELIFMQEVIRRAKNIAGADNMEEI